MPRPWAFGAHDPGEIARVKRHQVIDYHYATNPLDVSDWAVDMRMSLPVSKSVLLAQKPESAFLTATEERDFGERFAAKSRRPSLHDEVSTTFVDKLRDIVKQAKNARLEWPERIEQFPVRSARRRQAPAEEGGAARPPDGGPLRRGPPTHPRRRPEGAAAARRPQYRSGRRAVPAAQRLQRRPLPTVRPAVRPRAEQRRVLVGRRRPRPLQHLQDRLASGKPAAARPGSRTKPRPAGPHPRIRHVPRGRRSAFIATTAGFHVALEPGAPTTRTRASSLIHGPQMGHILWPRGEFSGLQRSIGSGTLITGTGL